MFSDNAIEDFEGARPGSGSAVQMNENFSVNLIATEEEHDRVMDLDATSNFALIRNALGYAKQQDYVQLGGYHAKVLAVRYEYIEASPRVPADSAFELTDSAMDWLEYNYELFQREHGDYFVAGYTWGLRNEATVEIITVPGESYAYTSDGACYNDAGKICDNAASLVKLILNNAYESAVIQRDHGTAYPYSMQINTKNVLINVALKELENNFHNVTIRVSHVTYTGVSGGNVSFTVREYMSSLMNYVRSAKNTSRSQYEQLYVTMKRYREIAAARSFIPEVLPITTEMYNRVRELTEKIYRTRCYYNALMSIPDSHLMGGSDMHEAWQDEFDGLIRSMERQLNKICGSMELMDYYYNEFDKLLQKYKPLAERYNYYRFLLALQKNHSSWSWSDSDADSDVSWGLWDGGYDKSTIVTGDFVSGGRFKHEEPATGGPGGAHFVADLGTRRVRYFNVGYHDTNHSKGWSNNGVTLGKNRIDWQFKCASSRRLEVFLEYSCVNMPSDKYPFVGLE